MRKLILALLLVGFASSLVISNEARAEVVIIHAKHKAKHHKKHHHHHKKKVS